MKRLLLVSGIALVMALSAGAQAPRPVYKVTKAVTPPDENDEIVYEIPDGEETYFSRNCESFKYEYGVVERTPIKGSLVRKVYVAEDGNIWLSNPLSDMMLLSYVKATQEENGSLVIQGPQLIYDEYDDWEEDFVNMYLVPMEIKYDEAGATYVATEDLRYVLKKTENGYEAENPELLLGLATYGELADPDGTPTGQEGYAWVGYGDKGITLESRPAANGVTLPEGVVAERWAFQDPYEKALVDVALDGDDIYIRGLDRGVPDAWVKGKLADGKVTIPSGTYLGYNRDIQYFSYIWGSTVEYDETEDALVGTETDRVVFNFNADAMRLDLQDGYAICSMPDDYYVLTLYNEVSITKQNRNIDTPPANPTDLSVVPYDEYFEAGMMDFNIPAVDQDGNLLEKDKLYYTVYIDGEVYVFKPEDYPDVESAEGIENVSYGFESYGMIFREGDYHSLFFNIELPEEGCGVQSMYINEEGRELRSAIVTSGDSGIGLNPASRTVRSCTFYNMQGQVVAPTYSGPVVCRTVYSDGTVKVTKLIRARR